MFEEMKSRHLFGWMFGAIIVSLFILLQVTDNPLILDVAMQLIFYTVVPLWFFSYHFKKRGVKLRQVLFFHGIISWLLPILGLTVLSMVFSIGMIWLLLRALLPIAPAAVDFVLMPQPFPDALWYLIATGIIVSLIGPIAEEFVFRGLILNRLITKFGFWNGLGLSSAIFGMFHIDFFGAFLFAVVASLLYLKTGNLLVPILLHIVNNTIAVYQSFANPTFPQWLMVTKVNDLYTKAVPNLIVLLVSLSLLLIIIAWMARDLEGKIKKDTIFSD